ncbi:MAG: substrate-binding domain-containing protein [Kiritimatiellaeota bacterium]|nr:substrate-binding domain-containing protein [Kiritimatiellota bacterium]
MNGRFQRQSLVAQVAAGVASGLRAKEWRGRLPAERELCVRLGVSRPILRAALSILCRKGLLRPVARQGIFIAPYASGARWKSANRVIGVLTSNPLHALPSQLQLLIRGIEHHLHVAGFELLVNVMVCQRGRSITKRLEELVSSNRAASWVLCSVTREIQAWFMRRHIPALVMGSCYPGMNLVEFDVDYEAVCRHAAATLLRLGHRRIAMLTLKTKFAGDLLGEQGFISAFQCGSWPGSLPRILYHDGSVPNIRRVLEPALTRPDAPTAFLVSHPYHALTLAGYLAQKGLRVPNDVSVICRDDDDFLDWYLPPIARYKVDDDLYALRSVRALIRLATGERCLRRLTPIPSQFIPGGTVAPPA